MSLPTATPPVHSSSIPIAGRGLLPVLLLACSLSAQTAPPTQAAATLESTTTLVYVPARVETPARELVYTLAASDFELTDNGVPQKFTCEANQAADPRPLALVVLVQIGGAAKGQFSNFARFDTMLSGMVQGPPDKIAIVQFDSRVEYDSPFTSDVAGWKDALDHPDQHGNDGAAIFDGLAYALDMLKQEPPGVRRAILLVSQQHDQGSKTKVKDIVREVGETNTAVYALTFSVEKATIKQAFSGFTHLTRADAPMGGPIDGFEGQDYFDVLAPLELAAGAMRTNFAAEVAGLSGGEPLPFSNKKQFDRAVHAVGNDIRNGYMLSFRPSSNEPGPHTLKLRVIDHPEWVIDARTLYWADSPEKGTE